MVEISNFIEATFVKLKHIKVGESVCISTFKKDRHLIVFKIDEDRFVLREQGYEKKIFHDLDKRGLKKLLKTLAKVEFPRSNMVHLSVLKK
ncbi:MAG: hypothetical protein ACRCX8_14880 [Sarcina sp.]